MLEVIRGSLFDLSKFGLNPRVVDVTMSMQLSERPQPFFLAAVVDKPTGALGEDQDERHQDKGRNDLNAKWDWREDIWSATDGVRNRVSALRLTPESSGIADRVGAVTEPSCNKGPYSEHELLQGSHPSSDAWMRDLSLINGNDHHEKTNA